MRDTLFVFINVDKKDSPYICAYRFLDFNANEKLKSAFRDDYNALAAHVMDNLEMGNDLTNNFSGKIGEYFQPRPKVGKNKEYSWAFYMKTKCWDLIP